MKKVSMYNASIIDVTARNWISIARIRPLLDKPFPFRVSKVLCRINEKSNDMHSVVHHTKSRMYSVRNVSLMEHQLQKFGTKLWNVLINLFSTIAHFAHEQEWIEMERGRLHEKENSFPSHFSSSLYNDHMRILMTGFSFHWRTFVFASERYATIHLNQYILSVPKYDLYTNLITLVNCLCRALGTVQRAKRFSQDGRVGAEESYTCAILHFEPGVN